MKIKDTLHLGKTKFPMRAGLPNKEPNYQKAWEENHLYEQRLKLNEGHEKFILHDGPPYANGNIHLGHALNKISKDIILRYKAMDGYYTPFVPGWDTHGLPIETALAKKGLKRKEMPIGEYLEDCRNYALEQVNKQRDDFKRLGILADWDNPYLTLQSNYEADQVRVFGKMAEKGYIYKGLKPIYWSPSSESSLAEAEIEYHDVKSPSLYVAFDVADGKDKISDDAQFIIWTTTPWTLPANLGIAVNAQYEYSEVEVDGKKYIVAKELIPKISEVLNWENVKELQVLMGSDLEYMTAKHPFYDRESLVMLGDHVTLDSGTGLVHTAPGHGEDDYQVGLKYKLDILSPVDSKGCLTDEAPGFEGIFYDKANPKVTELLEQKGKLLKLDFFTHSYPHDWRTKKPVIYRATPQWFASIADFRQDILDNIEKVNWLNPWGKTRIHNMIRDRGDWVISRQRAWGVPLPIFYAEDGEPIITPETIEHVANLIEKDGIKVWFESDVKDLLPEGFSSEHSPNGIFTKETDIMDVWFDSGSSHEAVLKDRSNLSFPADLVVEGSDQYRGWFNSSLTTSVAINEQAPYKTVLSQGFVLDGEGRKMSKSLGNTILPDKVWNQYGADILRLWVASVDYESDVRVSMDILQQVSEIYRKIRNTMRFLIANTEDFNPAQNNIDYKDLRSVDKYMLVRLQEVVKLCRNSYEHYKFSEVYKAIVNFCTTDLSSFYLDFAKDVVYIEGKNNYNRRCMQTVFYKIVVALVKLLNPILPFTSEEIWTFLKEDEEYAYLSDMIHAEVYPNSEELMDTWRAFMEFRDKVLKALEEARNNKLIGKSFEAKVTVYPLNDTVPVLLDAVNADIAQILIISDFAISQDSIPETAMKFDDVAIQVEKAHGYICDRCRAVKSEVGQNEQFPELCNRCIEIIEQEYPEVLEEGFEK